MVVIGGIYMFGMFRRSQITYCNDKTVHKIIKKVVKRFTNISKPVKVFVGYNQSEFDNFLLGEAGFTTTIKLSDYSPMMCGFYNNPKVYVLLINGENFYKTFKNKKEMMGIFAHEIAHFELFENVDIQISVPHPLLEVAERMKTYPSSYFFFANDSRPTLHSNEYLVDTLVLGRGFGRELILAWRVWREYNGGKLYRALISPEKIEELLHLKWDYKYLIRKKDEKPAVNGYAKAKMGTNLYCGHFQNGYLSGIGKFIFSNGDFFIGKFSNGNYLEGVLVTKEGVYSGQFINNKKNGYGRFYFNDGRTYDGSWGNDYYNGIGTLYNPSDKTASYGIWQNSVLKEIKSLQSSSFVHFDNANHKYSGDYLNGKAHGSGKMAFVDGHIYIGSFTNGQYAEGILLNPNGEIFWGNFHNNKKNGKGKLFYPNGSMYDGSWENDAPSYGTIYNAGGGMDSFSKPKNEQPSNVPVGLI